MAAYQTQGAASLCPGLCACWAFSPFYGAKTCSYKYRMNQNNLYFTTMEKIGDMKFYTFEEILDEQIGKKDTPERTLFEKEAKAKIDEDNLGERLYKKYQA